MVAKNSLSDLEQELAITKKNQEYLKTLLFNIDNPTELKNLKKQLRFTNELKRDLEQRIYRLKNEN
jgi:hypothetical protein